MESNRQGDPANSQDGREQAIRLIEQSLVAIRRDQAARRMQHRLEHGAAGEGDGWRHGGGHAPHGGGGGGERGRGGGHGDHGADGDPGLAGRGFRGNRRGRPDGSLGRAARFRMLDAIEAAEKNGEQLGVTAIAQSIGVDQPRASRLVQEGTEAGYLRRAVDASDARRAVVQLTAAGRRHLTEVRETRTSAISGAIEGFSPDELSTFATLFDRFVRAWPRD